MDIETPVTFGGLIIASIFLLVVNFAPRFYDFLKLRAEMKEREAKAQREAEAKAQQLETDKDERVFDRMIKEYDRQLKRNDQLELELKQLRPLALANAVLEQKMQLCREDKEDWKTHAEVLEEQLKKHNIVPAPFRRVPREGDTQEKIKTISRRMQAIQENHVAGKEPSEGTPTLVFPPVQKGGKE